MNFNEHSSIRGEHAFLSPSKYHWINYSPEKLITTFKKQQATIKGIELHEFACRAIELGIKLPKSKSIFNLYVNDAIGFKMTPEQPLYYSDNCFGTCDAISFRKNELRIHDLKTGTSPTSIHQLEVYTAIFCLEYKEDPRKLYIELRIYQGDEVLCHQPQVEDILRIMETIIEFDKFIENIKMEE